MQAESTPAKLKHEARALIKNAIPSVIIISVAWFAIAVIIQLLTGELSGTGKIIAELNNMRLRGETIDKYDFPNALLRFGSIPGSLLSLALSVCAALIETGFVWYTLRLSRGEKPDIKSLFDGFSRFGRVLWLCVLRGFIVSFCSLFLVIPGIIMWFRYSMALRVCYDNPDFSATRCLKESVHLMRELKIDYLTLGFSFFGWYMLGWLSAFVVGVSVTDIWLSLYSSVAASLFYERALSLRRIP